MTDLPAAAVTVVAEALAIHRWKTMGTASAECECGAVVYGDADPFPADEAFRRHLAAAVLEAAAPLVAAAERASIIQLATEHERKYVPSGVPSFADRLKGLP